MKINCVWEHNGNDTLLYAEDDIGAYTRGESLAIAIDKMPVEMISYMTWAGKDFPPCIEIAIAEEKSSDLTIKDADSDILFESEKAPLTQEEYQALKSLALKSAKDFLTLYASVPDKSISVSPERKTFYGQVPRSAHEMYEHTKSVNAYYFAEINIDADNNGTYTSAANAALKHLKQLPIIFKTPFLQEATENCCRFAKCCAVLSGTTAFMLRRCIVCRKSCLARNALQTRSASEFVTIHVISELTSPVRTDAY